MKVSNVFNKENLFQKTGVPFLVETTKIENTSFPFKTFPEANVKINTTTKWTYQKTGVLAVTTFIFRKFVSVLEPLK